MAAPRLEPFRPTPPERGLPHALKGPIRLALIVGGALLSREPGHRHLRARGSNRAVVGIGAAVVLGEDFGTNPTVTGSAVTFLSIVLGIVGASLGARIGHASAGAEDGDGFDRDRGT